jgi:cytochrome d ubiquinol oxidase subunit I
MQHPVGYAVAADGSVYLTDYWAVIFNPWAGWQYVHTMAGAVVTGSFVMASVGAYYLLANRSVEYGKMFLRTGLIAACLASIFQLFPSGDEQGKNIMQYQPPTLAAMEGLFDTKQGADLVILGQPDMEKMKMDNPARIPELLSFLTYHSWSAEVKGLDAFPRDQWPTNIPLLYYSYHIMVGLGTIFIAITVLSLFLLWRGVLFRARWLLWIVMFSFPFPYIANTAGWFTVELGRQPWLAYGLMRTAAGISPTVSAGNGLFTLLGFLGMYFLLGLMFLFLLARQIQAGPGYENAAEAAGGA